MKLFVVISLLVVTVLGVAPSARAQTHDVYLVAGALRSDSGDGLTAGAGGDRISRWGVSVGGDVAWFRFGEDRQFTNDRVLTAALHVGYFVGGRTNDARWHAFVTGGPAVFAAVGVGAGFSFGYGANVWVTRRVGVRGEMRVFRAVATDMQRLTSWRIGVSVR